MHGSGEAGRRYLFTPPGVSYGSEPDENESQGERPGRGRIRLDNTIRIKSDRSYL